MLNKLCAIALLLLILFHSGRAWSAEGPKLQKLVIGYAAPVVSLGIIDVIKRGGLFRKQGLDVELVFIQGSGVLTAAMVSGQVPLTFLAGAATVSSAIGGADTVLTACAINTLFWRLFSTPNNELPRSKLRGIRKAEVAPDVIACTQNPHLRSIS